MSNKLRIATALKSAISLEVLKPERVAEILDINEGYLSFLDSESSISKIPAGPWAKIENWCKSAMTIEDYALHNPKEEPKEPVEPALPIERYEMEVISRAVLDAIEKEDITYKDVASNFGINKSYLIWMKNEKYYRLIPKRVWITFREWMNSNQPISTVIKSEKCIEPAKPISSMRDEISEKVSELKPSGIIPATERKMPDKMQSTIDHSDSNYALASAIDQPEMNEKVSEELFPGECMLVKVRPEAIRKKAKELNVDTEVDELKKKMTILADTSKLPEYLNQLIKDKLFERMIDSVEIVVNLK